MSHDAAQQPDPINPPTWQDSLASAAAAEFVRAARQFLEAGSAAYMSKPQIVDAAMTRGCKFALRIMLPDGRVRVDVMTAEGEAVRLFEVAVGEAPRA